MVHKKSTSVIVLICVSYIGNDNIAETWTDQSVFFIMATQIYVFVDKK